MGPSRIGIVGAGVMGAGIARLLSGLGATTIVVAPRPGGVARAAQMIQRYYASDVTHGRLHADEALAGLAHVQITPRYADLADASFVVESVAEDLAAKQDVRAAVEAHTPPECVFATNTSSIPIAEIASGASRPGNVIGTHYFWPAHRYRLLEIVQAAATSESTLQRTLAFARWQEKTPLLARDVPGFFTTRVLLVYLNEAVALVAEGAPLDAVDQAMIAFGWAMGPFRLLDAVGIENLRGIYQAIHHHLRDRLSDLHRLWPVLEAGHVGSKGRRHEHAKGFYLYPGGVEVDVRVYPLIRRRVGAPPTAVEVSTRPVWQMINEIGHCLAEGVVASADDADLGAVLGLGWPPIHDTPLAYARRAGVRTIVEQLQAWAQRLGPRFIPSPGLLASSALGPSAVHNAKQHVRMM